MTSLERIMAVMQGNDTDFQPLTLLLSLYGANLTKCDTESYFKDPFLWFEGQKAIVGSFDPDILVTPFFLPGEAAAFGSELVYLSGYAPNIKKPVINKLSEINNLELPDIKTSPFLKFFTKSIDLLSNEYKETKAIAAIILSPSDLPSLLFGAEMWIDTLLFHKKVAGYVLELAIEHFVNLGNDFLDRGANFIVLPLVFSNPLMVTDKILKFILPYLEKAFSKIKGPIIIHNGGHILKPYIEHFFNLPNVVGFVVDPKDSFYEIRSIIGDKAILMGNINGPYLNKMTVSQAESKCLDILNNRKNDKHYIFASSNADIAFETPFETIEAVTNTIRNFKKD